MNRVGNTWPQQVFVVDSIEYSPHIYVHMGTDVSISNTRLTSTVIFDRLSVCNMARIRVCALMSFIQRLLFVYTIDLFVHLFRTSPLKYFCSLIARVEKYFFPAHIA